MLYDRQPSDEEYKILLQLQTSISNLDINVLENKLKELHNMCEVGEYEPTGTSWKTIGFQQCNPSSDIRGGGELCIDNLIYFMKYNPIVAKQMMKRRSDRGEGGKNYPWAAVSISVSRLVASLFSIIDPIRGKTINRDVMHTISYYNLILEKDGFNRLYEQAFLMLDNEYDLIHATYMEFPIALENTKKKFQAIVVKSTSIDEIVVRVKEHINNHVCT